MAEETPLIIIGMGGFAASVIWAIHRINQVSPTFNIIGGCDDNAECKGREISGYPVLGTPEEVAATLDVKPHFVCPIGSDGSIRAQVARRALELGWTPATVIDPSVLVAENVEIGEGTYVGPNSVLSPNVRIGSFTLIVQFNTIGHDVVIGDYVQVFPGARVLGGCELKEGATICSNAVIAPYHSIGRYATLGANAFARKNVPDYTTMVGNPAKVLRVAIPEPDCTDDLASMKE